MDEKKEEILKTSEKNGETMNAELLTAIRGEVTLAILEIQRAYGMPAYIMDVVVSACLADIRDCATKELINK